ncbi:enoyl-CoA hydratase [Pseudonocardia oroxyli]|uniref:Enoyl-CoA hydratase/carnithine racemase n=1 Tax=Pseudonocardia oroxyli TaxID=366584 RepID=A0A1G7DVA3_PSEOR|nr:enoyl-CoA hydratase [Pseudonocardia oroxyli]SDE54925.1 Enoyl-CoA hydratase/carnithine racemase [Pseudonocardia oroxyli]
MSAPNDVVLVEDRGAVRIITMNRPAARNALSGDLIVALYAALVAADAAEPVRAVVLTGADPAFCAGVDLKQAAAEGEAYFRRHRDSPVIEQTGLMRTPIVGAVNGAAFTGGLELALGCDFLVASERAVFADTHTRVGVRPGGGMTARLPSLVGMGRARRMSLTGEVLDAAEAARIGLVTEVVAHGRLLDRAVELATAAAEPPADVVADVKRMYVEGSGAPVLAALATETAIARSGRTDMAALEERRRAVMARNRAQL